MHTLRVIMNTDPLVHLMHEIGLCDSECRLDELKIG